MIPIETAFFGLLLFFALVGALRGWAKELLVTFSVILARFIEFVMLNYVPVVAQSLQTLQVSDPRTWLYIRLLLFVTIVIFGYATTMISASLGKRARKEKFQDSLLGFFLGFINGFLIVGMIWGFLDAYGYNIWGITAPAADNVVAQGIIKWLPLHWLQGPALFVSVAVAFAFVLIVFI